MLIINKIDLGKLNIVKRQTKKTQILLYDTSRRTDDFIRMIKFRKNGEYEDIPHFIISKNGEIIQLFDTKYYSILYKEPNKDKKVIKIAVENLGWLEKNTILNIYSNWIGDPYRLEPYVKKWRDRYFWDSYTNEQINAISELINMLCETHNIIKKTVPDTEFLQNIFNFNGILCKSNFSDIYLDINPSFNLKNIFNNEEFINRVRPNKEDVEHIKET